MDKNLFNKEDLEGLAKILDEIAKIIYEPKNRDLIMRHTGAQHILACALDLHHIVALLTQRIMQDIHEEDWEVAEALFRATIDTRDLLGIYLGATDQEIILSSIIADAMPYIGTATWRI